MRIIDRIEDLDGIIAEANRLAPVDFPAMIDLLNSVKFSPGWTWESDCYSQAYRDQQMSLYSLIANRASYDPRRDEADCNVTLETGLHNPFPFSTRDPVTVGNYLMAAGFIIKTMNLPKDARVLEYGAGWGHTTTTLARMGYEVCAVDIEEKFLRIIETRAILEGNRVRVAKGLFGESPLPEGSYDAILFFECFHHCLDHISLIGRLKRLLKPGGQVVLCGEAIYCEGFDYPWGVRLDGHSVWAIRNYGWMELGFRESYILDLMMRHEFRVDLLELPEAGALGTLYRCVSC